MPATDFELARMQVDVGYHAAFMFWGLKGVVAERWAHGPTFGAWTDLGNQVNLNQSSSPAEVTKTAYYGINASGFNAEPVENRTETEAEAVSLIADVMEVFKPKRVTRISCTWWGLLPVKDPARTSEKLRERFYQEKEIEALLPEGRELGDIHNSAEFFTDDGRKNCTLVLGVVGPPHKGYYFAIPNEKRDSSWHLGLRYTSNIIDDDDGIAEPVAALRALLDEAYSDYRHAAKRVLPTFT
jgi:hypothetical protein